MKAVILAGGMGTRLRPLTNSMPKPLVPLLGKPLVSYIIDALPAQVDTVILAVSYMKGALEDYFRTHEVGKKIVLVNETDPLGTGGAIRNVAEHLDGTFFAFNGDIVSSIDLKALLRFHRSQGGIGTLSLWKVPDPTAFGVVGLNQEGRVFNFQEKPTKEEAISDLINAGVYVFEEDILDHIGSGKVSIEREVFPRILGQGLYGMRFEGYWIDCGTRENMLAAQRALLDRNGQKVAPSCRTSKAKLQAPNQIHAATLNACHIGPYAYLEDDVTVGNGSQVSDSMILRGAEIGEGSIVRGSIIGPGAKIEGGETVLDSIVVRHQ